MLKKIKTALITAWAVPCVASLAFYTHYHFESPGSDLNIQFALQMTVLNFPLGYVAGILALFLRDFVDGFVFFNLKGIWPAMHEILHGTVDRVIFGYYGFISLWLVMAAAGYYQWFVWLPEYVPRFVRWVRLKRKEPPAAIGGWEPKDQPARREGQRHTHSQ